MNDRLQQLALFVRTVETGSFSKAAREFGLAQPSASRAVAALERRLGVKLITRTTRQIAATDAGDALLVRARDALAAVEDAENAAQSANRLSGVLRVALSSTYGARRVIPLLPAFLASRPLLRIDLMMSDRYENLIAEGADVALRLGEQPD
jgi:DNA-binding transcriptional LysR family regulator